MTRERLPDRRQSRTMTLDYAGGQFDVSVGYFNDGRVGEVFAGGAKTGSDLNGLLSDAAIVLSLALQNGVAPAAFARTVGRLGDGHKPASIIGAIADLLASVVDDRSPAA